jgi:hypothetical protein
MPRGGARVGVGRRRKPIEEHLARGSYRRDRHGALSTDLLSRGNVLPVTVAPTVSWEPDAGDWASLGAVGRVFVERMLAGYSFTLTDGLVLLEAGRSADRLGRLRAQGEPAVRDEATLQRLFASFLGQLKVGGRMRPRGRSRRRTSRSIRGRWIFCSSATAVIRPSTRWSTSSARSRTNCRIWAAHRPALLHEAARRAIPRPIWGELHFEDTPAGEPPA